MVLGHVERLTNTRIGPVLALIKSVCVDERARVLQVVLWREGAQVRLEGNFCRDDARVEKVVCGPWGRLSTVEMKLSLVRKALGVHIHWERARECEMIAGGALVARCRTCGRGLGNILRENSGEAKAVAGPRLEAQRLGKTR